MHFFTAKMLVRSHLSLRIASDVAELAMTTVGASVGRHGRLDDYSLRSRRGGTHLLFSRMRLFISTGLSEMIQDGYLVATFGVDA